MEPLWYALYVRSGQEEQVRQLVNKNSEISIERTLIPKRKIWEKRQGDWHEVSKIMFPGYILLCAHMNVALYHQLQSIPGCLRLLNAYRYLFDYSADDASDVWKQSECFSEIPVEDMRLLLKLTEQGEEIGVSEVYIENTRVVVHSGPLKGFEGWIKKVDKRQRRVKVALPFMNEVKDMDMSVKFISKKTETIH
ncbi:antiterminator LoaP [Bacillus sp. FSL W7-1360]